MKSFKNLGVSMRPCSFYRNRPYFLADSRVALQYDPGMQWFGKRWRFATLTLALLLSAGLLTSSHFSSRSLKASYEVLEQGMTEQEVVSIVDQKTGLKPEWTLPFFAVWDDRWNRLEASFHDGRLAGKGIAISRQPTILRRARDNVIKALHGEPERDRYHKS